MKDNILMKKFVLNISLRLKNWSNFIPQCWEEIEIWFLKYSLFEAFLLKNNHLCFFIKPLPKLRVTRQGIIRWNMTLNFVQDTPEGITRWKIVFDFVGVMPQVRTRWKVISNFVQATRKKGLTRKGPNTEGVTQGA